jgi:hypothetical protein
MSKNRPFFIFIVPVIFVICLLLASCMEEGQVISKPDEYTRVFEANENNILLAIVQVFKEKGFVSATINAAKNQVESDYSIDGDWRSKSIARVKKITWKECEMTLSVITEKKTSTGWEMRRLLEKKQYDNFFDAIELQLYNEMYKVK